MKKYACVAAREGGARCRNLVDEVGVGVLCELHQKRKDEGREVNFSPPPDSVLVKFNINPNWAQKFEEVGVPRRSPNEVALEEKNIAQAHDLGREAYQYRDIADSGVPVFGEDGVTDVSILNLMTELQERGYSPRGVHIRTRRQKKFDVLVIPFTKGTEGNDSLSQRAVALLEEFLKVSCWGIAHIWANPPQENGKIIHTLNLTCREVDKAPQQNLCFNHGLWAVDA